MVTVFLTAGSIGVLCAAGGAISAALKFFNTWEPDFSSKPKAKSMRGGERNDRFENLQRKVRPGSEL